MRLTNALAIVTGLAAPAARAQLASSTFDTGPDGWTFTNPTDTQWVASGGNPGGYIRTVERVNPAPILLAPVEFLGDWRPLDGTGSLSVDHRVFHPGGCVFSRGPLSVHIAGPGGTASWRDSFVPNGPTAWLAREVPIAESAWTVDSGTWSALLAAVTEMGVHPELAGNNCNPQETNGVDNVILRGPDCYANCDPSRGVYILDTFDFLCFQNRFAALDPYACDCDTSGGPGVCDVFDFLCFQNAFAAGCP